MAPFVTDVGCKSCLPDTNATNLWAINRSHRAIKDTHGVVAGVRNGLTDRMSCAIPLRQDNA